MSCTVGGTFFVTPAGEFEQFSVSGTATGNGPVAVRFDLLLSDEELPGASMETNELFVVYDVTDEILLGDVNLDGSVNLLDVAPFIDVLNSGDFQHPLKGRPSAN